MADQTDHFMREVHDEMRKERLAQIWERYGIYIAAAAILLVVGVGSYKFIEYRNHSSREQAGRDFDAAVRLANDGKTQEAHQAFDAMIKTAPSGYGTLARLRNAGAFATEGKRDEAVAAYDAVQKDSSADPLLRDFAAIQAALLRVDGANWTEMQNRLKDLATDTNAWRAPARELLGLSAMKGGQTDDARKAFEQILADTTSPPAIAERARVLMTILTEAAVAKAAAAPGAEGAKPADAEAKK